MSLPTIPDIDPKITLDRCDTIHLLLSSIALEEIGLSHILNAEGEKLQTFLDNSPCDLHAYLNINDSINKTLRTIVSSQILLNFKLDSTLQLDEKACCHCTPCKKPCHCDPCKKKPCDQDPCIKWDEMNNLCYCPNKNKKNCSCSKCKEKKRKQQVEFCSKCNQEKTDCKCFKHKEC